ncbi:40800_t:CDS:2 [Gigaspora margarita]|uniref:40800_t:CDS:1 n=1 Tax=Gigaspora margarita TaxID=4874 RepID=A0ABN7W7K7_GIGMA|nr:40800_t:CDS:2 [Gigaspora margarita]
MTTSKVNQTDLVQKITMNILTRLRKPLESLNYLGNLNIQKSENSWEELPLKMMKTYVRDKNPIPKEFSTSTYELYVKDETKERVMVCVHFVVRWKMKRRM